MWDLKDSPKTLEAIRSRKNNNLKLPIFQPVLWRNPLLMALRFSAVEPFSRRGFSEMTGRNTGPPMWLSCGLLATKWVKKSKPWTRWSKLTNRSVLWCDLRLRQNLADTPPFSVCRMARPNLAKKCGAQFKPSNWTKSTSLLSKRCLRQNLFAKLKKVWRPCHLQRKRDKFRWLPKIFRVTTFIKQPVKVRLTRFQLTRKEMF